MDLHAVFDSCDDSSKTSPSRFLGSLFTHTHWFIGYHNKPQSLDESESLNVFETVTVFDTSVSTTLSPLPSPLDTTFPRST